MPYFIMERNENNINKNFDEKRKKCQESKWKYKVAFFTMMGLELSQQKL